MYCKIPDRSAQKKQRKKGSIMTDLPDPNKSSMKTTPRPVTGVPAWVIVFAIIAIVLIVLVITLHLMGVDFAGGHGL
jgi:hypothetical protein